MLPSRYWPFAAVLLLTLAFAWTLQWTAQAGWGVAVFGVWTLISVVPAYLGMADLGFTRALDPEDHDASRAGAAVDQRQAGHGLGVVADVVDAHLGQGLAGDGGNGDRRVLKNGRALQRRDDEFFNLRTARGGPLSPGGPAACDQQG